MKNEIGNNARIPLNLGQYIPVILENHLHVHLSLAYTTAFFIESIASGAKHYVLFRNPAGVHHIHLRDWHVTAPAGPTYITLLEAATVTAAGSQKTPLNNNRKSLNTTTLEVYDGSAVTPATGTLMEPHLVVGDKKSGGEEGEDKEWILDNDTDYVFVIDNQSGGILTNTEFYAFFIEPNYIP